MTVPLWRCASKPAFVRCEALVIGGGITGLAAALALERAGLDALIVERGEIGSGASGRNAGYLMRGAADNYAAAVRDLGRGRAGHLWRWTEENLALLRAEGVEAIPSYRRVPSCLLAMTEPERLEIERSRDLMIEDGFEVEWRESGSDAAWRGGRVLAGLVNPADASVNPHEMLQLLASKLRRRPMMGAEVASVARTERGVRATTADALIEARRAIVCLNAFTPLLLPALLGRIEPRRGQMLAFRAPPDLFEMSYYADHGSEYFRQADGETAVVGGWRKHFASAEVGYEERTTDDVQRGLERYIGGIIGEPPRVGARWSGTMGFTRDGLPIVGPVDDRGEPAALDSPLWVCGGYTGHGMSMAFRTALDAVEAMLSGRAPVFDVRRAT